MEIPKIFWQSYKTHQVPEKWKISPISIKKYHPGWKYNLTDDKENRQFVKDNYPQYLDVYDRVGREIKFICSVDLVRYLYLHKYGGVYLDLDYEILKPLDDLFESSLDVYLVKTSNWSGYTNSFMASKPNSRFWINCIEKIKYRLDNCPWYIFGDLRVLWTTGPSLLSAVADEYNKPIVTIPYKLGHPNNIYNNNPISQDSYVRELPGSSWVSPSSRLFHIVIKNKYQSILIFIVILILIILFIIWLRNSRK